MIEVISFGEPENEAERLAIIYLRNHLNNPYKLFTNLEISQGNELFEIDLILLAPHAVYIIDVKNIHGRVGVDSFKWYPENKQPYPSPLKKFRKHAKVLKSLICDVSFAMREQLNKIYVQETILMANPDVIVDDDTGRESEHITYLDKRCLQYFQSGDRIPSRFTRNIHSHYPLIERAIGDKSRSRTTPLRYRDWQVEEKLGGNDRFTEYRARKTTLGVSGWTVRLRVYQVDPFLDDEERQQEYKRIGTAFQSVFGLPPYPNILSVQDFFESDEADYLVLVTEDIPGQALRQHIKKQDLSLEQKLNIVRDVLHALDHAHRHGVIHRNLTPDTILVTTEGQAKLTGFDYAQISNRTSTIAEMIQEELEEYTAYQAIECQNNPGNASPQSDLFSAGLIFYELLVGAPAFQDAQQMHDCRAVFPIRPTEQNPSLLPQIDQWLQKLCAYEVKERFSSADAAIQAFPTVALPSPDLKSLLTDYIIDDRYRVIGRLGEPGSFAVAYHVLDTLAGAERVLKLVTRDRRSVYERLQQEYKILLKIQGNPHPNIVNVIWADRLKDGVPFIVFEYVEGQDVKQIIQDLNLEQAIQLIQQAISGIAHIHQQGIYHQDIKPSNLLLTSQGVKIIDFNVAIADGDEMTISAGTRRYLPPDFQPKSQPTTAEKIDRDLYALGITFYECVTGHYPFDEPQPPLGKLPGDPRSLEGCEDLADELVHILMKAIAPQRGDRFAAAKEFQEAIESLSTSQTSLNTPPDNPNESHDLQGQEQHEEATPEGSSYTKAESLQGFYNEEPLASEADAPILVSQIAPPFHIFDAPVPTNLGKPDPDRPIVLDPTGRYQPSSAYILISSEMEWIHSFGVSTSPYWVRNKRLCDWAYEWLRVRGKTALIAEIKPDPRQKLQTLFHPLSLPAEWTDEQVFNLAARLDSYPSDHPIAYLLADATRTDHQLWTAQPSIEHLAHWLSVPVPDEFKFLERVWQQQVQTQTLSPYYQTEDKLNLLRQWIGIVEPAIPTLGKYPLPIPECLAAEFDQYWEQKLYATEAKILDSLVPPEQIGMERIASQAYKVLYNRSQWITGVRESKLGGYLSYQQKVDLRDRQSPPQPSPLSPNATCQEALKWVTDCYLPFRRWEIVINCPPSDQCISDRIADSFVEWIAKHYPELEPVPVAQSLLNYNVAHHVTTLCQQSPVFWVVVDGMGWLDHLELLGYLAEHCQLSVATAIQPRFSILPTKTEYAKWSLYAQLMPKPPHWTDDKGDVSKAFQRLGVGKRYTDGQIDKLYSDLKNQSKSQKLYCWDTTLLDKLYHDQKDWQGLYRVERTHVLEGIAKKIGYSLTQYPEPDKLKVVIATDHGQMMGMSNQLASCPPELKAEGRVAFGSTDDPRFVVLTRDRYHLPNDISVVRGSASLNSFSYTADKAIIGSHGGLFPEEVVVGFSVLCRSVQRSPVLITCSGEGRPLQSGEIELIVDNPNPVPLTNLCLYINEIPSLRTGKPLSTTISPNKKELIKVPISDCPELPISHHGNQLALSGQLTFQYAGAESGVASLDNASTITIHQIFRSGLDIDEFL